MRRSRWCCGRSGTIVSLVLAITYVGLFAALGTLLAMRWLARVERRRAAIVLGEPIEERYRPLSDEPRSYAARLHELIGEGSTWRDFGWSAAWGWIGPMAAGLAVGLWVGVLGMVALPAWYWAIPAAPTALASTASRSRSPPRPSGCC